MNISVERLRRWMLAAAALLVIVIAAFLMVRGRMQRWGRARANDQLHKLGVDIVSETNDFTISQSGGEGGKTLYTIHASKEVQHRNGQITLHDVSITLYGRKHDREDHISGSEFEYDQPAAMVSAAGEVHIDLQAPVPEGKTPPPSTANGEGENVIHVKTHGLVFWQKMGMAATRQELEFQVRGMTGSAVGAEYSSDTGLLVLQSQVKAAGLANGRPMHLEAAHAELNRSTQRATLRQVRFEGQRTGGGGPEKMSAEEAVVLLTEAGIPRHVDASGGVTLQPANGRTVSSAKMAVDLNAAGQPQNLYASGGVRYAGDEPLRKGTASAQDARVWFDGQGRAQRMVATGKVEMLQRTHPAAAAPWTTRSLSGDQVDATFVPAGAGKQVAVSEIQATGAARLVAEDPAAAKAGVPAGSTTTTLTANRIDTRLLGTADGLAHLHGEGRAELLQASSDGARQDDRGDAMDVAFRPAPARGAKRPAEAAAPGNIVSASLQGHVAMTETAARRSLDGKAPATGHGSASRADYDAAQDRIVLTGSAQWTSAGRTVWADRISTDRTSGDAEAQGGVKASIVKEGAPATAEATHVTADHARIHRATQTAEFFGSGSVPVRMWQGSSQVEAPMLVLEQAQQRLTARGNGPGMQVHSVFAGTRAAARAGGTPRVEVVRIASHELVYSDGPRQGVFRGGVQVQSADGSVTAEHAEVWLQPADATQPAGVKAAAGVFGGSVDHMVASGRVRLTQPGRRGTGEQLVYTAAGQRFVLTGTPAEPPMLTDRRGTTTGASLIFHAGDDSVEILGGPAGDASREVHTETRVKPRTRQP